MTEGCLALLILLDQLPRNIFRGTAKSFATDPKALAVAQHGVANGFHLAIKPSIGRMFFILPFMHSEVLAVQDVCMDLVHAYPSDDPFKGNIMSSAVQHRDAIVRFGRFPGRNVALGRVSTPEEVAYLEQNH